MILNSMTLHLNFPNFVLVLLFSVPFYTVIKLDTSSAKAVQGTSNRKVNLAVTQSLHQLKVFEVAASTSICDRYRAPFRKSTHELLIHSFLQAFIIRGMNKELGTVWFQSPDGFCFWSVADRRCL